MAADFSGHVDISVWGKLQKKLRHMAVRLNVDNIFISIINVCKLNCTRGDEHKSIALV